MRGFGGMWCIPLIDDCMISRLLPFCAQEGYGTGVGGGGGP